MAGKLVSVSLTADVSRFLEAWQAVASAVARDWSARAPSFSDDVVRRVRRELIARHPAALRGLDPGPAPGELTPWRFLP